MAPSHRREDSFTEIDSAEASGILATVLRENHVYLGGSSMGRGLKKAARYYMQQRRINNPLPDFLKLPGASGLNDSADLSALAEDPFYVVDIGVLVSQVYQWRRYFPRVEPFYAVKCNPDPVIVKTLALLGCNFDCASKQEISLVRSVSKDLPRQPDIIYANPCKAVSHLVYAVCHGVRIVTFDNASEIAKCAAISKDIQLILRIITDDRGSQCRLSSKFGAPRFKWRALLQAAQEHDMKVIGVSFHVGSGCRDATRYEDALKDAKEIFEMAESEFGMKMTIIDIGGGFPGETHSMWNPAAELDPEAQVEEEEEEEEEEEDDGKEGKSDDGISESEEEDRFMYFTEIAEHVAPVLDRLFPPESGVRIIGEPGRYFVAASSTLCCSVVSTRHNALEAPEAVNDHEASAQLAEMSREEETKWVRQRGMSISLQETGDDEVLATIQEELADYSKLFATQELAQQEVDVYNDPLDLYNEGFASAADLLGPPDETQKFRTHHTVEGMTYPLVAVGSQDDEDEKEMTPLVTLAAAGEAAVNGVVLQAVADSAPLQDDYAYYINDGVYGAFNNIMFDHAHVRPRVLRAAENVHAKEFAGFHKLESSDGGRETPPPSRELFASTVFGPTCDSIDVIARSVLLPKLHVGDWMYFQNMGAYTMAAASSFNGFTPSERFYVCSVQPEYFGDLIKGPEMSTDEEKKED